MQMLQVDGMMYQSPWSVHGYRNTRQMGKLESPKMPFISARELQDTTDLPEQKGTLTLRLKEAGLRAQHAVVKDLLTH
jgi:hypothetical protein